jgi:hypothetical protein
MRAIMAARWHGHDVPVIDSFCLSCASVTAFEQPPCPDEHGSECPERLCVLCGAAVLVGWPAIATQVTADRRRRTRAA